MDVRAELAAQRELIALATRDRQVRAHEHAHLAAAGDLARGGASFERIRGSDGRQYAVSGEVAIDTSAVADDPQATLDKARRIRRAALAPAQPSSQDLAVASRATAMENQARAELAQADRNPKAASGRAGPTPTEEASRVDEPGLPCTTCGGAHANGAHAGLTAYETVAGLRP